MVSLESAMVSSLCTMITTDDPVHHVCMMSDDGRHIVHSHGGQPGSDTGQ